MVGVNLKISAPTGAFRRPPEGLGQAIELAMDRYELAPVKEAAE